MRHHGGAAIEAVTAIRAAAHRTGPTATAFGAQHAACEARRCFEQDAAASATATAAAAMIGGAVDAAFAEAACRNDRSGHRKLSLARDLDEAAARTPRALLRRRNARLDPALAAGASTAR